MIEIGQAGGRALSFDIPTLIETRLLIQSNSGGGKSWAIRRLLEQSHGKVQQIVLDLEGEFSTLRAKFDYVIAGKGGDTAAHPKSAGLLAQRLLELGVSAICDLYELPAPARTQFVRYFLESLMRVRRELWHPVMIVIDEAHHFCPERGQVESFAAVIDLCTRGRKRGLCAVLATQRLSKLHKDACAELLNKMIGRTSLDIDQVRAADELGLIGKQERLALRNLEPGGFHVYGPALRLNRSVESGVVQVRVGEVKSHHPKVGTRQLEPPPVPTDKISKVLAKLADLPAEVEKEAKDIEALRRDNADLRRQITVSQRTQVAPCNHGPIIKELTEANKRSERAIATHLSSLKKVHESAVRLGASLTQAIEGLAGEKSETIAIPALSAPRQVERQNIPTRQPIARRDDIAPPEGITKPQKRILDSLALAESFGLSPVHKNALAALSGVRPTSGGYFNNLGALRSAGLIAYPGPSLVVLTNDGQKIADPPDDALGIGEYHSRWFSILTNPQALILSKLIEEHPRDLAKDELAESVGASSTSGGYFNNLGRLRTLGAIIYPTPGRVRASDLLFPEGLR